MKELIRVGVQEPVGLRSLCLNLKSCSRFASRPPRTRKSAREKKWNRGVVNFLCFPIEACSEVNDSNDRFLRAAGSSRGVAAMAMRFLLIPRGTPKQPHTKRKIQTKQRHDNAYIPSRTPNGTSTTHTHTHMPNFRQKPKHPSIHGRVHCSKNAAVSRGVCSPDAAHTCVEVVDVKHANRHVAETCGEQVKRSEDRDKISIATSEERGGEGRGGEGKGAG